MFRLFNRLSGIAASSLIFNAENIKEGKVKDTEIIPPMKVQAELQSKIDIAEKRYNENPSEKNITRLEKVQKDLEHAVRDNECLMKGCVPGDYIKGPNK